MKGGTDDSARLDEILRELRTLREAIAGSGRAG
jgi:hypothetical protein